MLSPHTLERTDLACALRWTARLNMHEAVANHFSLSLTNNADNQTLFLMNPNQQHFSQIKASDLLLLNAHNSQTPAQPNPPDPTAWALHSAIHRTCPHATCVLHLHPIYSTILASLENSALPPIDQNTATFYNRYLIDNAFGGLAFSEEGIRIANLLNSSPNKKVMIMGNHGILILGDSVADAFNRLYYFERAAETYIKALWTGQKLRLIDDSVAEKTAREMESYPDQSIKHFSELKSILDKENPSYKD